MGRTGELQRAAAVPPAPFVAVELDVVDVGAGGVSAGLVTAAGDGVFAAYDPRRSQATVELRRKGRWQRVARRRAALSPPFRFAFTLCENQVTGLADTGQGWRPLVTSRDRMAALIDLREPGTLAAHGYGYGPRRGGDGPVLAGVRAGSFGMVGVRDPHLVQHPDGSPYFRDGRLYLTMTCAGMGSFRQAHWGVFALDPADLTRLEHVAQLYAIRGGRVLGDHAGQLVVAADGRCTLVVSSWGDFDPGTGVHVRHLSTHSDLLAGVHLLATEPMALPTELSAWDPGLTRIDDRWYLSFAESPSQDPFEFRPGLAVADPGAGPDGPLRLVGTDSTVARCEGPILQRVQGEWCLLASDGKRREYRVYDLAMRLRGTLDAPYLTNIPHPQVVPLPDGSHLMVTFDGTPYGRPVLGYGSHGDLVILASRPPGAA